MKVYKDNIKIYDAKLLKLSKALKRLSLLRLAIFIAAIVILIYLVSIKLFTPLFTILPVLMIAFGVVITHYNKIAYQRKHTSFLKKINESEIQRTHCNLEEFDSGDRFIDKHHPYTSDLDIFEEHSIFQLVNRTTTESGMILLSKWLSEPASNNEIQDRQQAIKALTEKLEWRQDLQALGMHFKNKKSDYYKLLEWVEAPVVLLKNRLKYKVVSIILPVLFLSSAYLFYANLDSINLLIYLSFMITILIINFIILRKIKNLAEGIAETSSKNLSTLKGYQALIKKIENESFKSKKLNDLQSQLSDGKHSAHDEIKRLSSLLEFSQQRPIKKMPIGGNPYYPILNSFLLLDIHMIIGTEEWKIKNKAFLKQWAEVVSEFEVINSLAGFCYSNPTFTFPEITDKNNYVHFEALGHPLINGDKRVCNDFHSEGHGDVVMITGSNMAGKSTFLRAVGVNIVLALAGAPCCAKNGQVSKLQLFSSMRTEDNLKKGISSFYAELSRIEKMLKLIESNDNVYFLLDEMFKGTNSEDRHRGGFSFINQISKEKTSGIIATHDIELATLAERKKLATNYSFNSEIKNGVMIFNYILEPTICNDFNASTLMKQSGIKIISDFSEGEIEL